PSAADDVANLSNYHADRQYRYEISSNQGHRDLLSSYELGGLYHIITSMNMLFTRHARAKMSFYKLSEQRVRRVLHSPKRVEEGIAPKTVAAMQAAQSHEIWVMFQDSPTGRKIISAWRYPGVTKPRDKVAIKLMKKEYQEYAAYESVVRK